MIETDCTIYAWDWASKRIQETRLEYIIGKVMDLYNEYAFHNVLNLSPTNVVKTDSIDYKCTICLEPMKTNAGQLNCKHIFHLVCLVSLIKHNDDTCPLCRESFHSVTKVVVLTPEDIIKEVLDNTINQIC